MSLLAFGDDDDDDDAAFMPAEVMTLAAGEQRPNGIVGDEHAVYFIAQGTVPASIRRIDLRTLAVSTLVANVGNASRLYGDAEHLYYADDASAQIIAVSKADGTTRVLATSIGDLAASLALDERSVYWIGHDYMAGKALVRAVNKDGSGAREIASRTADLFGDVLVDTTLVYSMNREGVVGFDKATGAFQVIAPGDSFIVCSLAQDARALYWTDRGTNTLKTVAKRGGKPTLLAANLRVPGRIAVARDGTVYWANRGWADGDSATTGSVMKLAPGAMDPVVIAATLDHAIEPVLLEHAVVWSVHGAIAGTPRSGSIMAAPR